jgi:DNA modification methylase
MMPSMGTGNPTGNVLYYGDNLEILRRHIADESVDLIYLDPPFNSNRSYNVLFKQRSGEDSQAQIEAFDDTWTWSHEAEEQYLELIGGAAPVKVADAIEAMRRLLGDNDVLAYLVVMTARLVELYRVLKPTGSLFLHCDPTASHYLKLLLDAVFGADRFLSEVVWKRTSAHHRVRRFGPVHDIVLGYSKGESWTWNPQYVEYDQAYVERDYRRVEDGTGRRYRISDVTSNRPGGRYEWKGMSPPGNRYWAYSRETMDRFEAEGRIAYSSTGYPQLKRYLDEMPGQMVQDVWTDIQPINNRAAERLGYPTQKPLALLERIIRASSNEGDVVLDPFCGCGTTIDAAQKLGRRWIGIDITYLSIDLIVKRLRHTYGDTITKTFKAVGIPHDVEGARALFNSSPFDFERWAVSLVDGQPQQRSQVGDKGVDGVIRFPTDEKGGTERVLVSVKGGKQLGPQMVRDLGGTVVSQRASGGVLITLESPTRGMIEEVNRSGLFLAERHGKSFPKLQIITVADLLSGRRPKLPPTLLPYLPAQRRKDFQEEALF